MNMASGNISIQFIFVVILIWKTASCTVNQDVLKTAVEANNEFALNLLQKIYSNTKNVFYSPQSIAMAIAMTSLGARGNTLDEIDTAFHFSDVKNASSDSMGLHESFKELINSYQEGNNNFSLLLANRLFSANGIELLSQFVEDTEKYYKAAIQEVNFINGSAEEIINNWVAQQTEDKITELFQPGSLGADVLLVLVNAIYFKGRWKNEFDSENTIDRVFHMTADTSKNVKMMVRREEKYPYYYDEEKRLKVLELPYEGDKASMVLLLPEQDALSHLISNITTETLYDLFSKLQNITVNIQIPKFTIEAEYSLRDTLQDLGVKDLFSNSADLSGITNSAVKVSEVKHKAFVEVDETGTKAAAATGVVMVEIALRFYPEFIADHPFLFFIIDKTNKKRILFAGILQKP